MINQNFTDVISFYRYFVFLNSHEESLCKIKFVNCFGGVFLDHTTKMTIQFECNEETCIKLKIAQNRLKVFDVFS